MPLAVVEMDRKERGSIAEGLEVRALGSVLETILTLWVTSSESLDSVHIIRPVAIIIVPSLDNGKSLIR